MPSSSEATRILRDDLLAQLRIAQRPRTTAQLRLHAPDVPVAGVTVPCPPIHEQIYRVLCCLERQGLLTRGGREGREVTWTAAANPADREIAALEAAFSASNGQPAPRNDLARTTEQLSAGAHHAHRIAAGGDAASAAAALSRVLVDFAALLPTTAIRRGLP